MMLMLMQRMVSVPLPLPLPLGVDTGRHGGIHHPRLSGDDVLHSTGHDLMRSHVGNPIVDRLRCRMRVRVRVQAAVHPWVGDGGGIVPADRTLWFPRRRRRGRRRSRPVLLLATTIHRPTTTLRRRLPTLMGLPRRRRRRRRGMVRAIPRPNELVRLT